MGRGLHLNLVLHEGQTTLLWQGWVKPSNYSGGGDGKALKEGTGRKPYLFAGSRRCSVRR